MFDLGGRTQKFLLRQKAHFDSLQQCFWLAYIKEAIQNCLVSSTFGAFTGVAWPGLFQSSPVVFHSASTAFYTSIHSTGDE